MTKIPRLTDILKYNSSLEQEKKMQFHLYADVKVKVMRGSRVCVCVCLCCALTKLPVRLQAFRLSTAVLNPEDSTALMAPSGIYSTQETNRCTGRSIRVGHTCLQGKKNVRRHNNSRGCFFAIDKMTGLGHFWMHPHTLRSWKPARVFKCEQAKSRQGLQKQRC